MGMHSIMVIKNEKGEYLQYFDERWDSYLFLNCKMPDGADTDRVKDKIATDFDIDISKVKVQLVGNKQHKKFSESAKIEKEYVHFFYKIQLDISLSDDDFSLNGVKYRWFSYTDLLEDERIQKVNSDIVQFVKEFNM